MATSDDVPTDETFTRVTPPRRVDAAALDAMAPGETHDDVERWDDPLVAYDRYYAVARIEGVLSYGPTAYDSRDACRVLYVDGDAARAVEREYLLVEGDWTGVKQHVLVADDSACVRPLARRHADRFAPALALHGVGADDATAAAGQGGL